jgi:AcrR family transcriptional regulator
VTCEMLAVKGSGPTKPTRRARAKATEWRIVKAAYEVFCRQGYVGATMAQIAEAAGVAVQTVYFTFHTKAALLSRAYDFAVMGDEEPLAPERQPWYTAMRSEPAIPRAVRLFVTGVGEITRRVTPIRVAARVAADGDSETARVMAFHEKWRADGFREVLELLRTKAELRPGLTLERATDLLLLLAGADVYHFLVDSRGWSHDDWVDWTVAAVTEQIFGSNVLGTESRRGSQAIPPPR